MQADSRYDMVLFKWADVNVLVSKKPKCLDGLLMSFIHPNGSPKTVIFPNNEASFTRRHFWTKREYWQENIIKLGSEQYPRK